MRIGMMWELSLHEPEGICDFRFAICDWFGPWALDLGFWTFLPGSMVPMRMRSMGRLSMNRRSDGPLNTLKSAKEKGRIENQGPSPLACLAGSFPDPRLKTQDFRLDTWAQLSSLSFQRLSTHRQTNTVPVP
jgi:hypothetical protein